MNVSGSQGGGGGMIWWSQGGVCVCEGKKDNMERQCQEVILHRMVLHRTVASCWCIAMECTEDREKDIGTKQGRRCHSLTELQPMGQGLDLHTFLGEGAWATVVS